jgi:hypothetical protein
MADSSANMVVEIRSNRDHQTEYAKYKFSRRLNHWKMRQDYLTKNITRMRERITFHNRKAEYYEAKLFEYESYMIVLNPVGEQIVQVKSDAATRLQEAIQEAENESDDESVISNDDTDAQSVATCDTVAEMREMVAKRMGRR